MFICLLKKSDIGIDENMPLINLKEIITDSLRYSASDLKMVVLLGLVLLLADGANDISFTGVIADELRLVFFAAVILLAIFEAGYIFRILEETIQGSNKLPKFNNLKLMFIHGIKELTVLILYFLTPFLFFGFFYLYFLTSLNFNHTSIVTDIFFMLILSLTIVIYVFFPAVLLHRAHNNGNFRSSFDFREIYQKIRAVGLKRLIVVYLGLFLVVSIVKTVLSTGVAENVPFLGELISDLIIAPYLLIFTTRVLGLIDQP